MSIIANDPKKVPKVILQLEPSHPTLAPFPQTWLTGMLNDMTSKNKNLGVKRKYYYLITTDSYVSWLQPTAVLRDWNHFLNHCRMQGYNYIMFKIL